ncbi:hypothetical protein [Deinococcus knuensis]|uniref:Uncharacterized protein n=1 Tax=Deinococcus knuensis TaxID=1837380 RepID=A0ABQ2SH65_9DEIO|nr:hypothetical protein [Deinococcus knuensis]GGS25973.1 hypothetical protein GCM10008961_16850 [Deinococcus knuensis]
MSLKEPQRSIGRVAVTVAAQLISIHHHLYRKVPPTPSTTAHLKRLNTELWAQIRHLDTGEDEAEVSEAALLSAADILAAAPEDRPTLCALRLCDAAACINCSDSVEAAKSLVCLALYFQSHLPSEPNPDRPPPTVRPLTNREDLYQEFLSCVGWECLVKELEIDEQAVSTQSWLKLQRRFQCQIELAPPPSQKERDLVQEYERSVSTVTSDDGWILASLKTIGGKVIPYRSLTAWTADSCLEELIAQRLRLRVDEDAVRSPLPDPQMPQERTRQQHHLA